VQEGIAELILTKSLEKLAASYIEPQAWNSFSYSGKPP